MLETSWFCFLGDFWPFWALLKRPLGILSLFFLGFLSKTKTRSFGSFSAKLLFWGVGSTCGKPSMFLIGLLVCFAFSSGCLGL